MAKATFIAATSDYENSGADAVTNRVREGRVEVEDDEMEFPMIRLGVSNDTGREPLGYISEYATLTPAQARKVAAALNRAAKIASEHIRATGWTDEEQGDGEDE